MTTIPTIGTFSVFLLRVFTTNGFFSSRFFCLLLHALRLKLGSSEREPAKALVHSFSFDFERPEKDEKQRGGSCTSKKKLNYFYSLFAFNITTTHHVLTETLKTIQVSTSKRSNTRTFRSRCGMSEDKTKFVRCGDTTSKTRKA